MAEMTEDAFAAGIAISAVNRTGKFAFVSIQWARFLGAM